MGYQNGNRSRKLNQLMVDINFDLDDLLNDAEILVSTGNMEQLVQNLKFVKESYRRLSVGLRRKYKIK